jgi:hypothetical protein
MDAQEFNKLLKKWSPVLNEDSLPKIKDKTRMLTTVLMMENQVKHFKEEFRTGGGYKPKTLLGEDIPTNFMGTSSATHGTGGIDIYNPVLISLLRRTVPNLIAYDLVGVQPMTGPTGLIFAFRPRYANQSGPETWFGEANTDFSASPNGNSAFLANSQLYVVQTGLSPALANSTNYANSSDANSYSVQHGLTTALSEALGTANNTFNEMAFTIESVQVTAKARGLRAGYTRELAQDLRTVHGLDAETELANILAQQILFDINREVIRTVNIVAVPGAQSGTAVAGQFNLDIDSDGRWSVEKFKGLLFRFEREANAIAKATRRGKGNFILCGSDTASAMRMTGLLDYNPQLAVDLQVDDTGNTFAGTLNGSIKVYIDPYFQSSGGYEYATMGYKGASQFDAGIFYTPYIPLEQYSAVDPLSFQPSIGYKTRYGLVTNPFAQPVGSVDGTIVAGQNIYYRRIAILNLT